MMKSPRITTSGSREATCVMLAKSIIWCFPKSPMFSCWMPLQKAQHAQGSASRQKLAGMGRRPEHQCDCRSSDLSTLPPDGGGTSHNIAAGNDEPDGQRSKA